VYPLKLNVNPEGWRIFMHRRSDPRFINFTQKILRRDNFSCQYCGQKSTQHQEMINLDQNYFNNKISNLVTSCSFCAQCFFLESVGAGYGGGVLIYLPEISQNHLNALCHVLFSAMDNDTEYKGTAQNVYRHLKLRAHVIEDELGEGMDEPALFGQLLIEFDTRTLFVEKVFSSVRLLPSHAVFKTEKRLDAPESLNQ